MKRRLTGRTRRKVRIRRKVHGTAVRPRLTVFRSSKYIYAQVIDDTEGRTIASASSAKATVEGNKLDAAKAVGDRVAKACLEKGVEQVVFDRSGYQYHGRVRALAESAREAGLKF